MSDFTHFNKQGRAKMVDISEKNESKRTAVAKTSVEVLPEIYEKIQSGSMGKGDVLSVAQVAGVMAAKNTSQWIPMCHPLSLTGVDISFSWEEKANSWLLHIEVTVKTTGKTGVEMEALTAASATALTVYDMCKAIDKGMIIGPTFLLRKTGGKSGDFQQEQFIDKN
ncbi:cyclic pyranopterin monophosphate synthase MoaC [Halalkalibacterium ligniniphilum]|uniref:cyclic pyranopterin monophosphate synthase MoaC n=1 Tax=Halalkalibacterium ligniniphilum TaxID=1134413 RepID=UPI00034D44AD|nr:cyclic pyranopterin monophosphate synthase MoaC [Halalkalibacterium ligniniphilum]